MLREALPFELIEAITKSLWCPANVDVIALIRWHRCCRALYMLYINQEPAVLRDAIKGKIQHAASHGKEMPSGDHFRQYLILRRASIQMGLCALVHVELVKTFERFTKECASTVPVRHFLEKRAFPLEGLRLEMINGLDFKGGANADALRALSYCAMWISARYGWTLLIRCTSYRGAKMHKFPKMRPLTLRPRPYMLYIKIPKQSQKHMQ
jgi:hypothetical protein